MGSSESTDSGGEAEEAPPSTPLGIVEKNNMELWIFLILIVATLLAIMFLTIEIIVFFFPTLVTSNHVCGTTTTTPAGSSSNATTIIINNNSSSSSHVASALNQPNKSQQPAFDSYAAWLTRIRTTTPPKPKPPQIPQPPAVAS